MKRRRKVSPVGTPPPEVNFLDAATQQRRARDRAHEQRLARKTAEAKAQHAATSPYADLRVASRSRARPVRA